MRFRALPPLCAVLVLAACNNPFELEPDFNFASFTIITEVVEGQQQGPQAVPVALFARTAGVEVADSRVRQDTCRLQQYTNEPAPFPSGFIFVNAGANVAFTTDLGQGTLMPQNVSGFEQYALAQGVGVPYTPGSQVTFTVPGAADGFPSTTFTAPTAPAFQLGPTPSNPAAGMALTWTPAGDDSTTMIISLQYADQSLPQLNSQILCSLVDDGSYTIPSNLLGGWRESSLRRVQASRYRTTLRRAPMDNNTRLFLFASYTMTRNNVP